MPSTITHSYESGLSELPDSEVTWILGGLALEAAENGDEGFDDNGDVDSDDHAGPLDGVFPGIQRLGSREVSITCRMAGSDGSDLPAKRADFAAQLDVLRKVTSLLPDRTATRLLRFRRLGEEGKRLYVRPPRGKSLTVPGDEERMKFGKTKAIVVRMEAPDPIIYSDAKHSITFSAGETLVLPNAGSFTAKAPLIPWTLDAEGTVTLTHMDYPDEVVTFPSSGHLHVSHAPGTQDFEIAAHNGIYGKCTGPSGRLRPNLPLLRPGDNHIRASAACTITWRDTW